MAIEEKRSKLKEEYHGLSGKEIAALKKSGVEITHLETAKQFVFMGDTTVRVFEDHPEVLEYPLIFIECTLFGDSKLEQNARNTTHVHWNFLKPIVKANPHCLFMLIHFSLRWNEHQIEEYFDEQVKEEGITNLGLWLDKGVKDYSRRQFPRPMIPPMRTIANKSMQPIFSVVCEIKPNPKLFFGGKIGHPARSGNHTSSGTKMLSESLVHKQVNELLKEGLYRSADLLVRHGQIGEPAGTRLTLCAGQAQCIMKADTENAGILQTYARLLVKKKEYSRAIVRVYRSTKSEPLTNTHLEIDLFPKNVESVGKNCAAFSCSNEGQDQWTSRNGQMLHETQPKSRCASQPPFDSSRTTFHSHSSNDCTTVSRSRSI